MTRKQIAKELQGMALGNDWPMFCYLSDEAHAYAGQFLYGEHFAGVTEEEKRMFLLFIAESLS